MFNQYWGTVPSFSLSNRLLRVLWGLVYFILFRYSPIPLHGWRKLLLQIFRAKVGKGVRVYPKVEIWAPWNLELADQCVIGNGVKLYSQEKITIGKRTTVSPGSHLCTGTHDYLNPRFSLISKPITIGDYSWIAAEAFIHPGIMIGEGCVIGARSVVTKDMPGWMICAGHPCVPLKERVIKERRHNFIY